METDQLQQGNTTLTQLKVICKTATEHPSENTFLWADAPASSSGWDTWQADITAGGGDGWGDSISQSAFPGFRQDEGESSDGTSSATSSDSGTEFIDMSDLQPMSDAQASEHVFLAIQDASPSMAKTDRKASPNISQKCTFLRETSRICEGRHHRFGFGDHRGRRSYVVTQDDIRAYFGSPGKEQAVALEKGTVGSATHVVVTEIS
jgi:hypothetical protein